MKNMESGKNKAVNGFFLRIFISVVGCLAVYSIHDFSVEIYSSHYTVRSHGVGLGFVGGYIIFMTFPVVVTSSFFSVKYSLLLMLVSSCYLFYTWFELHPLRVLLVFVSSLLGYLSVLFLKYFLFRKKSE
ncbi:hypothetical protein AHU65_002173 [Salmonella enterica subsp. enterica]|nr:hypothetical protein [Salmonella enterica subsp. enterica serovar Miami]